MKDEELLISLKESLRNCAGWEGDEIAADRVAAWDYYFGRPRGDEVVGRSQVVSGDLSAMTEANLAQMLDAFSSNNIVEFGSFGPEDEDQAQLESDTVSYFVMEENNGFKELAGAIKNALVIRNGFVKVWNEERRYPELERYSGVTPEALAQLTNRPNTETKVLKYDPETGELRLRVVYTVRKVRVANIAPENLFYLRDWDSVDLQRIPFIAERHVDKRSDLVELGFSKTKVKELKPYNVTANSAAEAARNVGGRTEDHNQGTDSSQDSVEWYEAYVMYDSDGDGISERHRVCFADETILDDEEVSLVPYAAGVVFENPNRLTGISLYDKVRQVQDLNTGLTRALMDNVNTITKNRIVVLDGKVNQDDMADGRTNAPLRVKNVPSVADAVMPLNVLDLTAGILANIQHQNQVRSEMGGAALDMASGQMQIGGDRMGSQGLDRAYSVMEQLAAHMTKNLAESLIKNTFLLAHATLRENGMEASPIKKNGKWFKPNPAEWPRRSCISVKVGMSPGERARKAATLRQVVADQVQFTQMGLAGGVLLDASGFYKALTDWMRVSDIANPEQYFIDPQTPESQKAQQAAAQAQQAQQQKQEALMQKAVALEEIRSAIEKYKSDQETQFKYEELYKTLELEEGKVVGNAQIEFLKAQEVAAHGQDPASASAQE